MPSLGAVRRGGIRPPRSAKAWRRSGMSTNILVGTPCYGGLVNTNYLHSLLAMGRRLRERNLSLIHI